ARCSVVAGVECRQGERGLRTQSACGPDHALGFQAGEVPSGPNRSSGYPTCEHPSRGQSCIVGFSEQLGRASGMTQESLADPVHPAYTNYLAGCNQLILKANSCTVG